MIRGDFHPENVRIGIGTMPQNEAALKTAAAMLMDGKRRINFFWGVKNVFSKR